MHVYYLDCDYLNCDDIHYTIIALYYYHTCLLMILQVLLQTSYHQISFETVNVHLLLSTFHHPPLAIRPIICHPSLTIHSVPTAICRLPPTVCHPTFTVHRLLSAVPSTIQCPPSTIHSLSYTVYCTLSAVHCPQSTIHHLPSTIYHPQTYININIYIFILLLLLERYAYKSKDCFS